MRIALIIIAAMLGLALADWPYVYYQVLRWAVMIVTGVAAWMLFGRDKMPPAWTATGIAILFNPLRPFYIDREVWQVLDVIAAIVVLAVVLPPFARRKATAE